jgi:hypothetical protein
MVRRSRMTEKQATKAWHEKRITLSEYHKILERIATNRNKRNMSRRRNKRSMSSSKWS